jgi:hypothetical protein
VELAEWIIRKPDQPAGADAFRQQKQNLDNQLFQSRSPRPDATEDAVQVFYLDPAMTLQTLKELAQKVRATTKTLRIFYK